MMIMLNYNTIVYDELKYVADNNMHDMLNFYLIEAVVLTCSVKKVLLEISQNSQKNTCARVSFLIKLQAWGLNTFFVEPLVAASDLTFAVIIFTSA